jgi:uncharacterized protein (DUF2141 family)
MSFIRNISLLILCAILFTPTAFAQDGAAPPAGTITLQISGIEKIKGELRCRLYNNEANFPSKDETEIYRFLIVPVTAETAVVSFEKLPFGQYGVVVHHDWNNNGKVDKTWYRAPKEPVACSNGATGSFGPPKWMDAVVDLNQNELILPITFK